METFGTKISPQQATAIEKTKEFAVLLCDGTLQGLALDIKNYLLAGIGTIPEAVTHFNLQEIYAPSANAKSLENALRLFINRTFTVEELSIYKNHIKNRKRESMRRTNQHYAETINLGRKSQATKEKRAHRAKERWENMPKDEQTIRILNASESARQKSVSLGGFDSKNPEQMEFFLNQCKEVIHENGKPDFNQIAINMNLQFGIDRPRTYWVSKYFQIRQKEEH